MTDAAAHRTQADAALLPLVAIVGPTASGKTDAAIALCRALGGEVVSMDSMQVYRGMDIGTAKPSLAERGGIAHHLLDVADPGEAFSVADYRALADAAIAQIRARGHLPVLVGGTGLYLNALTLEMDFAQAPADEAVRARLAQAALAEGGRERLHARLAEVDPASAARLHPNDLRRVVRALEIYEVTGLPMSAHATDMRPRRYAPHIAGLSMARPALYARIDARVDAMLAQGLLAEAAALRAAGVPDQSQAMQAIGYRELLSVLDGQADVREAAASIQQNSRRYAKRQMTWFGHDPRVTWFAREAYADTQALHEALLTWVRARLAERNEPHART